MEEMGLVCGSMALTVCCDTVHGVPRHLSGPNNRPVTTEPANLRLKTLRENLFSFKLITSDILLEQ